MSKFKKVLLVFLAILFVAIAILYILYQKQVVEVANNIWAFLNKPLPIIGVSLLIVGVFIYKLVYGKGKIKALESRYNAKLEELNQKEQDLDTFKGEIKQEVKEYKKVVKNVCLTIPNVKVNKLGKELEDGEE